MAMVLLLGLRLFGIEKCDMNVKNFYDEFIYSYRTITDIDELLEHLSQLETRQDAGEISEKQRYELQYRVFESLRELTQESPNRAKLIIIGQLLPNCIKTNVDEPGFWLSRHRSCLAEWLDQYPEQARINLREKIIATLLPHFSLANPQAVCWTISQIGYRDDRVVTALWDLVRKSPGKTGDVALATIVSLGVTRNAREELIPALHDRIADHFDSALCQAIIQLAEPTSLDVVHRNWLISDRYTLKTFDLLRILSVYQDVLSAHSESDTLQDSVWRTLESSADQMPQEFIDDIYRESFVASCNSPAVIPSIFSWARPLYTTGNTLNHRRYMIYRALQACVKPRHLEGWRTLKIDAEIFEQIKSDACQNTDDNGFIATRKGDEKKAAWDILLRAGRLEVLNWFNEAVDKEKGKFTKSEIIHFFACFKVDPLPSTVRKLIVEPFVDKLENNDSRELSHRMAAVRLARSAVSLDSFQSLLDFGYTVDGEVLLESTDALNEVALTLVRGGNRDIEEQLITAVLDRDSARKSEAAAIALEQVVRFGGSSVSKQVDRIEALLLDPKRSDYERSALLSVLGQLPDWDIPNELQALMEEWARVPDRWLGSVSLEILAQKGMLQEREDVLSESLGLIRSNGRWDIAHIARSSDWSPYFIGLLYRDNPEPYIPAIISLIKQDDWFPQQIVRWLIATHKTHQPPLPKEIAQALIERVYQRESSTYSEPEIFEVLAELAPEFLVNGDWEGWWDNWLYVARVGLADSLARVPPSFDSENRNKALALLQQLCLDSHYAVRRSAYRALAHLAPDTLYASCLAWADFPTVELNTRAVEAYSWLDATTLGVEEDALDQLLEKLRSHQEKAVREKIKPEIAAQRHRDWAGRYLSIVTNITGNSNEEIANAWCYARALAEIGDDSSIKALKEHLQKELLPNVRFWIEWLIKDLEKNWQRTVEKWPDPWFPWSGTVARGECTVLTDGGEEIEGIQYSIWRKRASHPSELESWGGAIWPIPLTASMGRGVRALKIQEAMPTEIVMTRSSNELVIFVGNGPYPGS